MPGDISFVTLPLFNHTEHRQVYQIAIHDPDVEILERQEVSMVYSSHELEHWVKEGKMAKPASYDFITSTDTAILGPGQKTELLFKF